MTAHDLSASPLRVVIVDDHEDTCTMLAEVLELHDFVVRWHTEGELAVADIVAHGAEVVITDLRMPGLGGIELARQLRSRESAAAMIAVSGDPGREDELAELFEARLTKPIDISQLPRLVRALGETARARCPRR